MEPPSLPVPPNRRARRPGASRGFTLIELIVVVIIISVFAALAIPQVTKQMRDRRVHETAQRIALIYQQARLRAMGEGGAVLVHYALGSGMGTFETRQALMGPTVGTCAIQPAASCTEANWDVPAALEYRTIETLDVKTEPGLELTLGGTTKSNVFAIAKTAPSSLAAPVATSVMDVCFTPLGRTFVRYSNAAGTVFTPLAGVPQVEVYRAIPGTPPAGLIRRVLVLPSGIARLQL